MMEIPRIVKSRNCSSFQETTPFQANQSHPLQDSSIVSRRLLSPYIYMSCTRSRSVPIDDWYSYGVPEVDRLLVQLLPVPEVDRLLVQLLPVPKVDRLLVQLMLYQKSINFWDSIKLYQKSIDFWDSINCTRSRSTFGTAFKPVAIDDWYRLIFRSDSSVLIISLLFFNITLTLISSK